MSKDYSSKIQKYHMFVDTDSDKGRVNITFTHEPVDGLAKCLRLAADAVEKEHG